MIKIAYIQNTGQLERANTKIRIFIDLLDEVEYDKTSLVLDVISKKPNDIVEQFKNKGIEDENTLFFAGCDSAEQALMCDYIEKLRSQRQRMSKSLT